MDGKNVNELTEVTTLTDESTMLVGEENTLKRISFANVRILFWTIINTVSNLATSAKNGLMAAVDKAKLDAMSDTLKNKTVSDSVVDSPDIIVSGKAVNGALANYGLSTINGIVYNEFVDDFSKKYISGSDFLQKYFSNLFTSGVFYALEITAIEKETGKYIRVLYNCKKNTTASYKAVESNGLSATGFNQYGTILLSGNTNNLIQKTKVLALVSNGTYVPIS